ncbi:hypothetical protein [Silanimonas sp.]|uniref:hypothetical protein n=1 Tax=Silanimonas sp. TaxID=1929290 RepID=UPI001BB97D6F|nr:hypothetical protein [Silanimonas sp.]MBS3896968.1 hypothetical protein [Silanimonas sp.]MBS3924029.1 hypothetical protein [Xanthomonadaceae bacterium]
MSTVWRWLSRLLLMLLFVVAAIAAIWGYGRLTSPTAAQQAALDLMQLPPPPDGDNGWAILMALPEAPAAALPSAVDCGDGMDCIAHIETALEANAATLEAWRPRLEAATRALRAPAFRSPEDLGPFDALPPFQPLLRLDGLRALDFLRGDPAAALDAACRDAQGAIVRVVRPGTLIEAIIGVAVFRQHATLIADMRRRAPMDALPASCTALGEAPDAAAEGTLCAAMRGEFQWLSQQLPAILDPLPTGYGPQRMAPLLHDIDWLLAHTAERYATACGPEAEAMARKDRAVVYEHIDLRWVDRVAFPVSVNLNEIAVPALFDYTERQLDFVAQRRLLAALLQMDTMAPTLSNAERFAALPAALRDGPRPLQLAEDGNSLSVPLRSPRSQEQPAEARLPLPQRPAAGSEAKAGGPTVGLD